MPWLESIGLGALQGLTEFLPVSSSGHLSIAEHFLGLAETPRFFDVMLHVGTLLAVLFFYRAMPGRLFRRAGQPGEFTLKRMAWISLYVVLATVPAVAAAALFRPTELEAGQSLTEIERTPTQWVGDLREYSSQQPAYVLLFMSLTGVVLIAGSRAQGGRIDASTMTAWHALGIGIGQMCSALMPGLSRSGMTVSTALILGLRPDWAVHFSLLMSLPAVLGAAVLKAKDADPSWLAQNVGVTIAGTLVAALVGWFCINLLLRAVQRGRWWWFAIYIWSFVLVAGCMLAQQSASASVPEPGRQAVDEPVALPELLPGIMHADDGTDP